MKSHVVHHNVEHHRSNQPFVLGGTKMHGLRLVGNVCVFMEVDHEVMFFF